jgi:alkanesulfonate monooxygenase SsuD/methylene tetrahydromethanopterin reductase-like flavin-dependent oxidoreductase (luciferase family)
VIKERWRVDVPRPVRNPIPILIGGGGERMTLKIVAEHADIWNVLGTPDEFRHKSEVLDHWCQEVGRDARAIERSIAFDADQLSQLDAYWEAGATHFIMGLGYPWNFETVERLVGWRERQ